MRRRSVAVITVWFALVLVSPWLGKVTRGWTATAIDNRAPAPLPGLSPFDWLRPETWAQVSRSLDDHLPGRDQAVRARATVDERVFSDLSNPQVLAGSDGWLFTADSLNLVCFQNRPPVDLDRVADRLDAVLTPPVSVYLVPDKLLALEPLASGVISSGCENRSPTAIRDARGPDTRIIDSWTTFGALTATEHWWKLDSHLNGKGEAVLVRQLINALAEPTPEGFAMAATMAEELEVTAGTGVEMDLPLLLGRNVAVDGPTLVVNRAGVSTTSPEIPDVPAPIVEYRSDGIGPFIEGHTVIIHDSQIARLRAQIAPFFRHVTFVQYEGLGDLPPRSALPLVRGADRIIIETVERQAYQRLTDALVVFATAAA